MTEINSSIFENRLYRTHDLLELSSVEAIQNINEAPPWVVETVAKCPYVVVRRQKQTAAGIAVGVRGSERSQRWGGFASSALIKSKISPFELRAKLHNIASVRFETIPALSHLRSLQKEWCQLELEWGPGGSIGFELATGHATSKPSSDLDIVLFAPHTFSIAYAQTLLQTANHISKAIDILVETPHCAFSLTEYSGSAGEEVMLRYADKPRIGTDPWCQSGVSKSGFEKSLTAKAGKPE